ncbi:MAG: Cytochrome b561 [Hydrocarboniphaga sp.]|uniref:cytochrome b/b6 domain-containing protein n=1 Tax=Hydrocarboniphaga sp. TaxID=2033016 RepID=UPI0026372EE1|nr:cytochrome b/b6 domain-containing protein [Hydrocarboniphaga sp.]MDB5972034.1 Cytochrome b561 [Hydrocarboniphaga sp.]
MIAPTPQPTASRYRPPAIALHWLIAVLIFGGFGLGLFMHELPASADKLRYFSWHKWTGVTVFGLALLRGIWRITHPVPPLPAGPRWEHAAAHLTHAALYLLMLAVPLSGWLHSSAAGYQTVYLGVLPIPDLLAKNLPLSEQLAKVHELLNYALLALLLLHAAAALQHHYLKRDDILRRMLPQARSGLGAGLVTLFAVAAFSGIAALLLLSDADEGEHHQHAAETAAAPAANLAGELNAEFRQMNVPVQGRFTAFHAEKLQFDAAHLDQASASIVVDSASFDLGDADYNAEVRKKEWFDSAAFPQARFESERVTRLADGRYQAAGQLTIKDKTQPAMAVFSVTEQADKATYTGEATISRAAFQIGDAEWNDVLEDAVIVRFTISVPKS